MDVQITLKDVRLFALSALRFVPKNVTIVVIMLYDCFLS